MLHILLLILKIIGIILAVILGILVLLICIVIFAPVRYELSGRCDGTLSSLKMKGKVTWLCSLVRADVYYKENKLKWRLRIAWKKFLGGQEYGADIPSDQKLSGEMSTQIKKTKGEEDEKKDEEAWDKHEVGEESSKEDWRNAEEDKEADEKLRCKGYYESGEDEKEDEDGQKSDEKDRHQPVEDEKDGKESEEEFGKDEKIYEEILESMEEEDSGDEKGDWKEREAGKDRDWKEREADKEQDHENGGRIRGFIQKIKELYSRIKCTIRKICDKIKKLLEKKNKIVGFIRDETHVEAFRKAKKEVFKLLRKLRPKKLLLEAEFGFDDPSWTGRTLAVIAPFYPLFGGFVSIKPDFTKRKLAGRLHVKGNIRFCHFAVMAWNLFWNRNVRRTYKDIRNFEI